MARRTARNRRRSDRGFSLVSFCQALIEASCLAALVAVPLFFNPQTERVFEPDKLALAALAALASIWSVVVLVGERFADHDEDADQTGESIADNLGRVPPLGWAVVLASAAIALGILLSTVPEVSFWGIYRRGQGGIAYASYLAILIAAAVTVWRAGGLARLRHALLLPLASVALYALTQRLGIDSVPWETHGASASERAFGPLGNPIFLGAYLIVLLPLAGAGLIESFTRHGSDEAPSAKALPSAAAHAALLVLGVAALLASQSRGPVLGLFAGVASFVILAAAAARRPRVVAATLGLGGAAVAVLAAAGQRLDLPVVGRLTALLATGSRTALERELTWQTMGELARSDMPRFIVGYGPDTLSYALTPLLPAELVKLLPGQVIDRAHNAVWEWWVSAGLPGVIAILALYAAAFYSGCRLLRLVSDRRQTLQLAGGMAGGLTLGAAVPLLIGRGAYVALGLQLGLLVGVLVYCAWVSGAPRRGAAADLAKGSGAPGWLVVALLSGISAHLVESAVGLPTAAAEVVFWVAIGCLLALAWREGIEKASAATEKAAGEASGRKKVGKPGRSPALPPVALGTVEGLGLSAVAHAPLLSPSPADSLSSPLLWLLLPVTWLAADLLVPPEGEGYRRRVAARLVTLGAFVVLWLALGARTGGSAIAYSVVLLGASLAIALDLAEYSPAGLLLGPAGATRASAARRRKGASRPRELSGLWRYVIYAALGVLALVVGWRVAIAPALADAHVRVGLESGVRGDIDSAREHFERAVQLWPEQVSYTTYVAAAYRDTMLRPSSSDHERRVAYEAIVGQLGPAAERIPDDALALRLATIHRDWADLAGGSLERQEALATAREFFDLAVDRFPRSSENLTERGALLERMGEHAAALADYEAARQLDPTSTEAAAGAARVRLIQGQVGPAAESLAEVVADDPAAGESLLATVQASAEWHPDPTTVRLTEALALGLLGRNQEALDAAAEVVDGDDTTDAQRLTALSVWSWIESRDAGSGEG